jgi:hypothetical protein
MSRSEKAFDEFESEITRLLSDLESRIARFKSDFIKWMFIFFIGQVAVVAGMLYYFAQKYGS